MAATPPGPDAAAVRRRDGLLIREWRPPSGEPRGAFLLLHGMESHSGWFADFAPRLAAAGWAVVAPDRSGWGGSAGQRGRLASYRDFVEEASELAAETGARFGPPHLAGMSWGGLAALYLALRRSWLFASLSLLAPGIVSRGDLGLPGRLRVAAAILAGRPERRVETLFRPADFTSVPAWRDFIARDPDRIRNPDASFCLETLKMRRFVRETAGRRRLPPGLCLLAGEDRLIDNRETGRICRQAGLAVETLAGAAHTLIFDQPAETADRLNRHARAAVASAAGGKSARPVWVAGGGAAGGALAALLSFGGVETGVLVKPGRAGRLRAEGLRLSSGRGWRLARERIVWAESAGELPPRPALILVAVKGFDSVSALDALAGRLPADAALATLQNGLANEERLAAAFPGRIVIAAALCAGLESPSPGLISWPGDRGGLGAAVFRGDAEPAREIWQGLLGATGLKCRWYSGPDAARRLKLSKLVLNAGFNALNALTGLTSSELLRHPEHGGLVVRAMREGLAVMRALRLPPLDLPGYPIRSLALLLRLPAPLARRILAWNQGSGPEAAFSLRRDLLSGRGRTEADDLNGALVRLGRESGVPVPANLELLRRIREREDETSSRRSAGG